MKKVHFTDKYLLNPTHQITVSMIGTGGTGSQVLTCLARINHALQALGHPGLYVQAYDHDSVSESNIGRQLFSVSDLGLNKADVLITRLNRFFGTDWVSHPKRFDKESGCNNITISCVDNIKSRLEIEKILKKGRNGNDYSERFYWMDFGNGQNFGQVVLGTIGKIRQPKSRKYKPVEKLNTVTEYFDFTQVNEKDSGPSCSLAEALRKQDLFINSTLAQLGSALLWKLITNGMIDYQGMYLNLETMNMNPIKL